VTHFWQLAFRNLWERKARTLFTASGILLGVAAMLAISIMSASTVQSLRDFFAQSSGRANLTISAAGNSSEGIPRRMLPRVQAFAGVADAAGITSNRVALIIEGKAIGLSVVGIDPESDSRLRTYTLAEGRMVGPREKSHNIVLVAKFARDHALALDDNLTLTLADGTSQKFKVVGLLADEGAGHLNGGSVGFVNIDVAQDVFARGSRLDQIDLTATPELAASSDALKRLKDNLQADLGDKYVVTFPASTGESISQAVSGLNLGLGIFGMIALFVGMLLIYNTFAMTVAERTRDIGMLRALGATRRQVLGQVLVEALFLGIIGTSMGVGGGLLLSVPLTKLMEQLFGGGITLGTFVLPVDGLVQAVVVGLITTVVAAFLPAWQASRITPTEAMRARGGGQEGFWLRHGWQIGLALLFVAGLDVAGVIRLGIGPQFFIFLFLGAILVMPNFIILLERGGRGVLGVLYGPMAQLGGRNLERSRARTAMTVGVLMIGVVMNVAIGAMSSSFRRSIDDWINAAVGGDFVVTGSEAMRSDIARELLAVPGVGAITPERLYQQKIAGTMTADGFKARDDAIGLLAIDPETFRTVSTMQLGGGEDLNTAMDELAGGDSVFVSTVMADRWGVQRGDSIRLRTTRGERDFHIAAKAITFWQGGLVLFMSRHDLERYYGDTRVSLFIVKKSPEAESADVRQALKDGPGKLHNLEILSGDDYRRSFTTQIEGFLLLFDAMVWIAVIVGALGVINTMTMNVLERVREIGTLRSIGMTRGQLAQMVLSEAGAMGALGALFGILVALPVSTVMVSGMQQGSGFPMTYVFPGTAFVVGMLIALAVSQAAAIYPTWRAGRIVITEAIKEE
jgi:putative ABC transport system permease protein